MCDSALWQTPFILSYSLFNTLLSDHILLKTDILMHHEHICRTLSAVCVRITAQALLLKMQIERSFLKLDWIHDLLMRVGEHDHIVVIGLGGTWGIEGGVAVLHGETGSWTHRFSSLSSLAFGLLVQTLSPGVISRFWIHIAASALILFGAREA